MKYAIMSDVHANPDALETALADARERGCGRFLMLGDITGYGYDPKRTLKIVRDNFDVVLMGNRDSACIGKEPAISVMFTAYTIPTPGGSSSGVCRLISHRT